LPRQTAKITIDTTGLRRDMGRLTTALGFRGTGEAHAQAERTAERIRAQTPVDTGALLATIGVVATWVAATRRSPGGDGWGVTYGTGLGRYPWVVNSRQRVVKKGARGARTEFKRALDGVAAEEVNRL
jgi:hypothetical protein